MPAFALPIEDREALAMYLRSVNGPAAEATVEGDAEAGRHFFSGKGQCASCHMVYGGGKPVGPDLSNAGNEMTVDEIRESLLEPSAHITPGYTVVRVKLRDGGTVRGFARNRTNYDINIQDFEGQ